MLHFWFDVKQKVLKDYNKNLYKLNQKVILKKGNESFECTIKGVDESGRLLVSDTIQDSFSFGEVEWVI